MIDELKKLRELTETLTGNGYLRDHTEEWEYALDAIPDYIYIINNRFEIKFVNSVLSKKIGISKEALYGKICYQALHGIEIATPPKDWRNCREVKETPLLSDVYLYNLNGWFDITRSPIHTKTNKLLGFICILQDITETKKAIEQRKKAEEIARESRMKYKLIIDNVLDIIWTTDLNLNFTFVNYAVKTLLDYSPEEFVGHNVSEFALKEDFEFMLNKTEYIISRQIFDSMEFESYMLNKHNEKVFVSIGVKALIDYEGNITGFQGTTKIIG